MASVFAHVASGALLANNPISIRINNDVQEQGIDAIIDSLGGDLPSLRSGTVTADGATLVFYRSTKKENCFDQECLTVIQYKRNGNSNQLLTFMSDVARVYPDTIRSDGIFRTYLFIESINPTKEPKVIALISNDKLIAAGAL
jgi:hypothetical protein